MIRLAIERDLRAINDIYNYYSRTGFSTFSAETTLTERNKWFEQFNTPKHLCLVAIDEYDQICGVTASFAYRGGGVFANTVETSLYVKDTHHGRGIGSQLYSELFARLENTEVHRVVVGIALPNDGSVAIHRKFGFTDIGIFDQYAFYKDQYRSSLWMQKKFEE